MTEAPARPWYATWFDQDVYDVVYARHDGQEARGLVALICRTLALPPGAPVVDVACGRGRHAVELARQGFRVTGTDLSGRALAIARQRAREAGVDVDFRQADMRVPVCTACADAVVNLFTAFGYFEDEADDRRALAAMAQAVRAGGWLVQDFLNAPAVAAGLVPHSTRHEAGLTIEETRWIEGGRVNKRITLHAEGEAPHAFDESVRLYTRADLEALHARCGLEVQHVFGDYDGAPHTGASPRVVLFSRKK